MASHVPSSLNCSRPKWPVPYSARWTTGRAIVAQGRTLVPNDFVAEIAQADYERLEVYADNLGLELATLARDYAREQGYSFVGPVRIRFEGVPDLTIGTFRIRSGVIRGTTVEDGEIRRPVSDLPAAGGVPRVAAAAGVDRRAGPRRGNAADLPADLTADHSRSWHRLRSAARGPGRLPAPRRDPGRGWRRGAGGPGFDKRNVRGRPADPENLAHRRYSRYPWPHDPGIPQGRYVLTNYRTTNEKHQLLTQQPRCTRGPRGLSAT